MICSFGLLGIAHTPVTDLVKCCETFFYPEFTFILLNLFWLAKHSILTLLLRSCRPKRHFSHTQSDSIWPNISSAKERLVVVLWHESLTLVGANAWHIPHAHHSIRMDAHLLLLLLFELLLLLLWGLQELRVIDDLLLLLYLLWRLLRRFRLDHDGRFLTDSKACNHPNLWGSSVVICIVYV